MMLCVCKPIMLRFSLMEKRTNDVVCVCKPIMLRFSLEKRTNDVVCV
jgi:hypothetical protein